LNNITFDRALIRGIKYKIGKGGSVVSTIEFVAAFTAKNAETLTGDKFAVFTREDVPRESLRKTELEVEVYNVRLVHVPQSMKQYTLDITPDHLGKFVVFRSGGKKKGKAALVRVKFEASIHGAIHQAHMLLDHVGQVGMAEGAMTVTALSEQKDMFEKPKSETEEKKGRTRKSKKGADAEQTTIPAPDHHTEPLPAESENVPVTPEAAAEVLEIERQAAATSETAVLTERQYPEAKEDGTFPLDAADKIVYAHDGGKAVATIYVLEVKEGFASGYSVAFANNVGERRSLPDLLSIHTSESAARTAAAEGVFKFAQTIYAEGTPQVKNVARQVEVWAAQYMMREAVTA
jgi:hypothetical protein